MTQTHLNMEMNQTIQPTHSSQQTSYKPLEKITLPLGLVGFSGPQEFSLTSIGDQEKMFQLREKTGHKLEFIIMRIDQGPNSITQQDVHEAVSQSDLIQLEEPFQVFVLISIHEEKTENRPIKATANLKAPLIISESSGIGAQIILSQDKYKIQHPLTQNPISW